MRPKFPKVAEARQLLADRAASILGLYLSIIEQARVDGQLDVAAEHTRWLLEHIPADENGVRVIDPSAAKVKELPQGPTQAPIQIGIALGGIKPKALPAAIIDVEPED